MRQQRLPDGRWLATRIVLLCCTSAIVWPTELRPQASSTAPPGSNAPFEVPSWAFPLPTPRPAPVADSVTLLHVPGSREAFTQAQVLDLFEAPDWHPKTHPPMPAVVAHGRKPAVMACAFCHLPDGAGRPENAMLAGLPAAYIAQQVADMKSRARQSAWHGAYRPTDLMRAVADSATAAEVEQAAHYFSHLPLRRRSRVVEANDVPRLSPALGVYVPAPGGGVERLGQRLIEMPEDPSRHELRDAAVPYITYVPPGSLARGRSLATTPSRVGGKPCTSCHGPELRGVGLVPPLAGRSPSYMLRQLLAFKTGSRATPAGAPMRDVTMTLEVGDLIAAAAYAGAKEP